MSQLTVQEPAYVLETRRPRRVSRTQRAPQGHSECEISGLAYLPPEKQSGQAPHGTGRTSLPLLPSGPGGVHAPVHAWDLANAQGGPRETDCNIYFSRRWESRPPPLARSPARMFPTPVARMPAYAAILDDMVVESRRMTVATAKPASMAPTPQVAPPPVGSGRRQGLPW